MPMPYPLPGVQTAKAFAPVVKPLAGMFGYGSSPKPAASPSPVAVPTTQTPPASSPRAPTAPTNPIPGHFQVPEGAKTRWQNAQTAQRTGVPVSHFKPHSADSAPGVVAAEQAKAKRVARQKQLEAEMARVHGIQDKNTADFKAYAQKRQTQLNEQASGLRTDAQQRESDAARANALANLGYDVSAAWKGRGAYQNAAPRYKDATSDRNWSEYNTRSAGFYNDQAERATRLASGYDRWTKPGHDWSRPLWTGANSMEQVGSQQPGYYRQDKDGKFYHDEYSGNPYGPGSMSAASDWASALGIPKIGQAPMLQPATPKPPGKAPQQLLQEADQVQANAKAGAMALKAKAGNVMPMNKIASDKPATAVLYHLVKVAAQRIPAGPGMADNSYVDPAYAKKLETANKPAVAPAPKPVAKPSPFSLTKGK